MAPSIHVAKSLYVEAPRDGDERTVWPVAYVDRDRPILLQGIVANGAGVKTLALQRSEDNGRSWQNVEEWRWEQPIDEHLVWNRGLSVLFLDPTHNSLGRIVVEQQRDTRIPAYVKENPYSRFRRLSYQISTDAGRSWAEPIRLIVEGDDETHWAPGVEYGVNSMMPCGSPPVVLDGGRVCVSYNVYRADKDGDLGPDAPGGYEACCLLGTWADDHRSIAWRAGQSVTLERDRSIEGVCEGTILPLPDGRLFMGLRASTGCRAHATGPCYKWYAVSEDRGV